MRGALHLICQGGPYQLPSFFGGSGSGLLPAPFITRLIVFFSRMFRFGRKEKKVPPKAYFDVLYLDDQLRIHRTREDNLFVQAKDTWKEAKPFLA